MTLDNRVTCYEGDHEITLYLSVIPLFVYVIGWPAAIGTIFYSANARLKLNDSNYIMMYGFLYKRYETQWFFWHVFIAINKLFFVVLKTFFFLKFMQGPLVMSLLPHSCCVVLRFMLFAGNGGGVSLNHDAGLRWSIRVQRT